MTCVHPGCRWVARNATGRCVLHSHPSSYDTETEGEWRTRSAVESSENVELQWLRTFDAADTREHPARLRYPAHDWFHQ